MHNTTQASSCVTQKKILLVQHDSTAPIEIFPSLHIPEQSLAQGIWLSGKISAPALCSGLGRCGACKVQFLSPPPHVLPMEKSILGEEAINKGWRLACRHRLDALFAHTDTVHLKVPEFSAPSKIQHTESIGNTIGFLAMDLGTTSLCWQVLSPEGQILAKGSQLNPQMGAGADIISRLAVAMHPEGKAQLATLIHDTVQDILKSLAPQISITQICLAANTAMTSIFFEKDIQSLAHAPYALPLQGHETVHVRQWPPIYIPPQLAPFVGGDISAGYAALLQKKDLVYPFLLADLGTNGEFILALSPEKALITSVPMGPSLEGIGLSFGHMAHGSAGIVHAVRLAPTGLIPLTLQNDAPQKICGTGYISLLHTLVKVGCLTREGLFNSTATKSTPFSKKILEHLALHAGEHVLYLWPKLTANTAPSAGSMYLSGSDVEEILKVKAAFSFAMSQLLHHAQLPALALQKIYLAGAMGNYVAYADLEGLGFVPEGMGARMQSIGNSALEGAGHLLFHENTRTQLATWSKNCTSIALTEDTHFTEKFMQHMIFSYEG